MSRREQARTDDSIVSVTDSLRLLMATGLRYAGDITGLTFLDETALRSFGPEQLLHRLLSTKSYISTTSSNAARNQNAQENAELQMMELLGKGQCGTVFALTGTSMVLKVMNESKKAQLWNDYRMHRVIEDAFTNSFLEFRKDLNIPDCREWIHPSNTLFWEDTASSLPSQHSKTYGIVSKRIYSLPLPVRSAMVDAFASSTIKQRKTEFLAEDKNKNCLVRLYLGRRLKRTVTDNFKLANFDLMINEMEYLHLDTEMYATTMAKALSVLHWKAGVDANDVEFVLGSAPTHKRAATTAEFVAGGPDDARFLGQNLDFKRRTVGVWLLDFNECKPFTHDANGLKQLRDGFYFNDPYYPRPGSDNKNDKTLWQTFKNVYLTTSARITDSEMPKQFILAVEAEGTRRSGAGSLFG